MKMDADQFIELIQSVLTQDVQKALAEGKIEVHIGFQDFTQSDYEQVDIRPYCHITQVK